MSKSYNIFEVEKLVKCLKWKTEMERVKIYPN